MTVSPDVPGFATVDVTEIAFTDPSDLTDLALARAATLMPNWTPREGHPAVALIEAKAEMLAAVAGRVEAVLPAFMAQLVGMGGLPIDAGTPVTVDVDITVTDILGHTIPAGTRVVIGDPEATSPLTGTIDTAVVIDVGDSTGTGTITADTPRAVDGLSAATPVALIDVISFVDILTITAVTSAGTDPETDDDYLVRASAWQASLSQVLTIASQVGARALTDVRVGRALAVNRWDGVDPEDAGTIAGHITLLLLNTTGTALSGPVMTEIRDSLAAITAADLTLHAQAFTVITVDPTIQISVLSGNAPSTVTTAVEDAINAYIHPSTWTVGEAVRRTRLLQLVENVTGVNAATITLPAADVEIGDLELVTIGTLTVAVV